MLLDIHIHSVTTDRKKWERTVVESIILRPLDDASPFYF